MNRERGVTILEVLISALIFALIMAGLANIFIAGKKYILHSRSRISGGEIGRHFLDDMQMQVNQSSWNQTCLGNTSRCPDKTAGTTEGLDRSYRGNYSVTPGGPIANISRVKLTVNWTEEE